MIQKLVVGPKSRSISLTTPRHFPSGSLPNRSFLILFLTLFSNGLWDAFFSPLDTSRTILEPNMTPTWTKFGAMLDHFSDIFGLLFWHLNIRSFLRRFLIDFRPPASSKTPPLPVFLKIFAFASLSLLRPILDRFWLHFGTQNRFKIGPETVRKRIKVHYRF